MKISTVPLTDAELNYSPEEWAEALAEDPSCMRAYLAAAEERGRRRGETERDGEWRDALCVAMAALGTSVIINNRGTEKLNALYAGNLAPRDSGLRSCKACGSSAPHHHTVLEPRDSGKEE